MSQYPHSSHPGEGGEVDRPQACIPSISNKLHFQNPTLEFVMLNVVVGLRRDDGNLHAVMQNCESA
jgi:hypothetical protein